jgi:hypothetical protein
LSEFTISLGPQPELDADGRRERARRAREVIDGAGWVFDAYISEQTVRLLDSGAHDAATREDAYQQIRAATEMKGRLKQIIEVQQAEDLKNERNRKRSGDAE